MKHAAIFSLILVFLLCTFAVSSQQLQQGKNEEGNGVLNYEFYHLRSPGGIGQNSITSMAQDSLGQIWFSSKDGLIRYDSRDLFVYKYQPGNARSIQNNFINDVFIMRNGSIWIVNGKGLCKYHVETDDFERISVETLQESAIYSIAEDSKGLLWFLDDKNTLHSYQDRSEKLNSFHCLLESKADEKLALHHLLITKDDRIFITTNQRYFLEFVPETSSFRSIPLIIDEKLKSLHRKNAYATRLIEDHEGKIWLGTHFGFLVQYNPENDSMSRLHYQEPSTDDRPFYVMSLFEDAEKNIWVGTWFDGLYKIYPDKIHIDHIMPVKGQNASLSNNIVMAAFQDNAGYLWFGTEFAGINILKKENKFTVLFYHSWGNSSFPPFPYTAVGTDGDNRVWIGTDGAGLGYLDRPEKDMHLTGERIIGNETRVFCLLTDSRENLWIGSGNGLFNYNTGTGKVVHYRSEKNDFNSLSGRNVISLCEDKLGNIWAGTIHGGLSKFDLKTGRFQRFVHDIDNPASLSHNYVSAICCDRDNQIWIGTSDGLNKFNPATGNFTLFKSDYSNPNTVSANSINCIYEKEGNLWIGTKGGGLNGYNLLTHKFSYYLSGDGLPDDNVQGITSDTHDNLWLSTTRSISKFNLNTRQFVNYTESDGISNQSFIEDYGLQEFEFYENFAHRDKSGYLYFGGIGGMFYFHPDSLPQNKYKPPIWLHKFLVNGEQYQFTKNGVVTLGPGKNHLQFFLTVLNYIQPEKNQYAWFLENYDSAWIYAGTNAHTEYFDLPPGSYKFHYKGANNDGLWNEAGKPLLIIVKPRFCRTTLFYVLMALALSGLIIAIIFHIQGIKKRIRKLKQLRPYSQSNLDIMEASVINCRLKERMEKGKLFLDADLSLQKLSDLIETKPYYLSQVINQFHQRNFHEFINLYRVEFAKELLLQSPIKIESIAYDSGFNSISTFNVAFKKETGLTPTEFRKSTIG